jgi:hypothetical protein
MIWDTILTDAEMVLLNDMINTYKGDGESLKQYFNDDCSMENREYTTNSSRELLLFKSNNINSSSGTDRIRLKATNILFDTFSTTTTDKTVESTKMIIASSGNVGIANTSPKLTLDIGSTNANHNIGRAILTAGNIHAADKLDFLSIGRWDGGSTADMQFSGIKYGVTTAADAGETYNNHSCMTFYTWGNSISNSREVMRLTSRGKLGIGTLSPTELLDVNGNIKTSGNIISLGNVGIGTNNPVTTFDCRGTGYFQTVVIADIANIGNINNYQLRLNPPTSTNQYSSIQSTYVSSPTTYMPLVLNYNGGNVGIGSQYPNKNLEIYNTSPAISIKGSSEADTAILYLATPYTTASAYKCAIIAKGTSGWSRSYLHFV